MICRPIERPEIFQIPTTQTLRPVQPTPELKKYIRRAKIKQQVSGYFAGITGGFVGVIIMSLIQGNYLIALGFLGPTLAALIGVWAFYSKL